MNISLKSLLVIFDEDIFEDSQLDEDGIVSTKSATYSFSGGGGGGGGGGGR